MSPPSPVTGRHPAPTHAHGRERVALTEEARDLRRCAAMNTGHVAHASSLAELEKFAREGGEGRHFGPR
eukprot:7388268-Prymnesium_polylepis.1